MSSQNTDEDGGHGHAAESEAQKAQARTADFAEPALHFLDPFLFHGNTASAIGGIGGSTPNVDPTYAFHTPYVPVARGRVNFTVHVQHLRARLGTLVLRVHMLDNDSGLPARMVTSERIQLNRLAVVGEISVAFEAFRGATYALMGLVAGETDAHADGLHVSIDRLYDEAETLAEHRIDGRESRFGRNDVRRAPLILAVAAPTLAFPRSQPATPTQFEEPIFSKWDRALATTGQESLVRWGHIYAAHGLATYCAVAPGAYGLVLGPVDPGLAAWFTSAGANMTFADSVPQAAGTLSGLDYRTVNLLELPPDLTDFDFLCSINLGDRLISVRDVSAAVEASFYRLRPLGHALHVFGTGTRRPGFTRADIERLVLNLISRGHEVSQLRSPLFDTADLSKPGAFGLIVRRAKMSL